MKKFWSRYSYDVVKTFAFHTVFGVFGLASVTFFQSDAAKLGLTIFCIAFFMFLLYGEIWKIGTKDEAAGVESSKLTGFYIGLLGSAVDGILIILRVLSLIPGMPKIFEGIMVFVNLVYNGFYRGFMVIGIGDGKSFGSTVWFYLITAVPAIIACTLGYIFGRKNWHLTNIFIPVNPEEREKKDEEKKKKRLGNEDDK